MFELLTSDSAFVDGNEVNFSARWNPNDGLRFRFGVPEGTAEFLDAFEAEFKAYRTAVGEIVARFKQIIAPYDSGSLPDFESGGEGSSPSGATKQRPSVTDMVREFMSGANQLPEKITWPHIPSARVVDLRLRLMTEEWRELLEAMAAGNLVDIADALADLTVTVVGTAIAYGIPFDAVFAEVHRSNMTKIAGGKFNEYGKLLKGDLYDPPRVADILGVESW